VGIPYKAKPGQTITGVHNMESISEMAKMEWENWCGVNSALVAER
jgi:hypothetical protein